MESTCTQEADTKPPLSFHANPAMNRVCFAECYLSTDLRDMDRGPRVEKFKLIFCYHRGGKGWEQGEEVCLLGGRKGRQTDNTNVKGLPGYNPAGWKRDKRSIYWGERELPLFWRCALAEEMLIKPGPWFFNSLISLSLWWHVIISHQRTRDITSVWETLLFSTEDNLGVVLINWLLEFETLCSTGK